MKLNRIFAGLLILSIACITSCDKENGTENPNPSPPKNEVIMRNNQYEPATIVVTAGTTVKWINKDGHLHTVTSNDLSFESGDLEVDEVFSYTFTTVGSFPYHCTFHTGMTGRVVVQ